MQTACVRPPRSTLSFVITEGSLDRDPCAQAIEDEGADEWLDALRESREAINYLLIYYYLMTSSAVFHVLT